MVASAVLAVVLQTLGGHPAAAAPSAGTPSAEPGSWSVRDLGSGRWALAWTSPERLPVRSDRPTITGPAGAAVGPPTLAADGRTVRAVVTSTRRPTPSDFEVELSGALLDRAGAARAPSPAAAPGADPVGSVRRLAEDPGRPGPYPVVSSDYTRKPVKLAGMAQPIEMVGHVVEPAPGAATGKRPLVLFLHGRHDYCYQVGSSDPNFDWPCRGPMREVPSHLGYGYVQRVLASQGFTTVSVRMNGINAQDYALDDGGAGARAAIVARHLDYWTTIAARHHVDLSRVVLVGHSRGGEGVDRAALRIPLSAPYRVVGQVLIAPTDFASQAAPYVPTVTLLPYCDGDVSDLQGERFTDVARDVTSDDRSLKSSLLVMGANHNFFNTEWTPGTAAAPSFDDWSGKPSAACGTATPGRLSAGQQRAVGRAYVAGAVAQFTAAGRPQPYLPMFDGSRVSVASAGRAVVLSHAIGGGRDVRRPDRDTTLTLPSGADSAFCTGSTSEETRVGLCGSELADVTAPHWSAQQEPVPTRRFWQFGWTARGQSAGLQLERPLDLRRRVLDLRTIVDPRRGDVALRIRLTDAGGARATLSPVGGRAVPRLLTAPRVTKLWAQTVRLDPATAARTLDLARVVRVELVGDSADGRLWLADLASAPHRLPAVAARRVPTISIGSTRVAEGDGPGTAVAGVPYRLSHPLTVPGQFQVVTAGEEEGSLRQLTVDLAPGQTGGTIPVAYQPDTLDDAAEATTFVAGWATRNLMTDDYLGQLVVVDDDPTPKATVTRVRTTVREGASAQWRVTLATPIDYDTDVAGTVVRGPGTRLTGRDVPAGWLAEHASVRGTKPPLDQLGVGTYGLLRAGSRSVVLSVPVREDGAKEGRESLTLQVTALRSTATSTVYVAPSP